MADLITVSSIKTQARQKADMENSEFVSESELLGYINSSYAKLYDLLVASHADYYITSTSETITTGNVITIPTDFYKLKGLDVQLSGDFVTVSKFNFRDRNRITNGFNRAALQTNKRYRVLAGEIHILPEDDAVGTYKLWYTPRLTRLLLDTDTLDSINGWEEYIIVDVAIKMLLKEESDTSSLQIALREQEARVEAMSQTRDSEPETITDVSGLSSDSWGWFL